jgi:NADPH:quinone reductase-like Zn-dependent oxidoreductase
MMRAVTAADGRIVVEERPEPRPGSCDLLVRVAAAGINGADVHQKRGRYAAPPGAPPDILGLEFAGTVAAVGSEATRFAPGDRVMAIVGGGAQAELVTVHERLAMAIPDALGWSEAGAFPEVFTTAHDALFTQCGLSAGEALLVNGAAGGVGTAAVQLGVAAGARVTASVRDPSSRASVASLGVLAVAPEAVGDGGPYDVILELVGAPNLAANLSSLAIGGRIVVIGVGAGARTEIDLLKLMASRGTVRGSTLRARSLEERAVAARRVEAQVLPLVEAGRLRVVVDSAFALADAPAAYERFEGGGKLGKVVLAILEG